MHFANLKRPQVTRAKSIGVTEYRDELGGNRDSPEFEVVK